jgi:hypothetical protein
MLSACGGWLLRAMVISKNSCPNSAHFLRVGLVQNVRCLASTGHKLVLVILSDRNIVIGTKYVQSYEIFSKSANPSLQASLAAKVVP